MTGVNNHMHLHHSVIKDKCIFISITINSVTVWGYILHPVVSSSLPYHICSCLWWWQCGLAAIWIPLSHSICIVNDRSAHAVPVLRAATSQCRVTPCRSLSPPISPPFSLPFHPQAASTVSMLSSVSRTVAELTDTDEDWFCVCMCVCVLSSYRSGTAVEHPCKYWHVCKDHMDHW